MTTNLITIKAQPNPAQILLHTLEKFIRWNNPDLKFFLAGGAVLKAYNQEDIGTSDLDVFMGSHIDFLKLDQIFQKVSDGTSHQNCKMYKFLFNDESPFTQEQAEKANVIGKIDGKFKLRNHVPVQLITNKFYDSFDDLVKLFDFTICQIGYSRGVYYMTPEAYADNMAKDLSFSDNIDMSRFKHRRLLKYCKRGYTPDLEVFKKVFLEGNQLHIGDLNSNDDLDDYDL